MVSVVHLQRCRYSSLLPTTKLHAVTIHLKLVVEKEAAALCCSQRPMHAVTIRSELAVVVGVVVVLLMLAFDTCYLGNEDCMQ